MGPDLKRWLAKLTNNNGRGEYITDIIAMAYQEGREIVARSSQQRLSEVGGVRNNRLQLSRLERVIQRAGGKRCYWRA